MLAVLITNTGSVMSGALHCPPCCRSRCTVEHHPLLVATLNCPTDASEEALSHWRHVVYGFQQTGKWNWMLPVPDPLPAYRMSLLHWACYLVGNLMSSRSVALPPSITVIYSLLVLGGTAGGNTPLHLCCDMLASSGQDVWHRGKKFVRCLDQLLYFITAQQQDPSNDRTLWLKVINAQNAAGDTPLHVICRNDALHSIVHRMLAAGADVNIQSSGNTPKDVAKTCNNSQILHLLSDVDASRQDDDDDDDDEEFDVKSDDSGKGNVHDYELNQLSMSHTLKQFGLDVQVDRDDVSSQLEQFTETLKQNSETQLIDSIKTSVLEKLQKLNQYADSLSARLAGLDEEYAKLDAKRSKEQTDITELKAELERKHTERRLSAKQIHRTQQSIESIQCKRRAISQQLSSEQSTALSQ